MRVLIACEFSGIVREAFRRRGHDAWSCDLLPAEDGSGYHIQGDVRDVLHGTATGTYGGTCFADLSAYDKELVNQGILNEDLILWDLMIAHPPCDHLAVSGARWFKFKAREQAKAIEFVKMLASAPIERIAIENPIGVLPKRWRKWDQIIHPWQFGHGETKATCLWLKNLPKLVPTNIVEGRAARVHHEPPRPDRWKNRSRTYQGIADAMAEQWGILD